MELRTGVGLELHILDQESPHLVAESIGLKMALESESCFYSVSEDICDRLVEIEEDLHCQLRFDTSVIDKFVDRVNQAVANTVVWVSTPALTFLNNSSDFWSDRS